MRRSHETNIVLYSIYATILRRASHFGAKYIYALRFFVHVLYTFFLRRRAAPTELVFLPPISSPFRPLPTPAYVEHIVSSSGTSVQKASF